MLKSHLNLSSLCSVCLEPLSCLGVTSLSKVVVVNTLLHEALDFGLELAKRLSEANVFGTAHRSLLFFHWRLLRFQSLFNGHSR